MALTVSGSDPYPSARKVLLEKKLNKDLRSRDGNIINSHNMATALGVVNDTITDSGTENVLETLDTNNTGGKYIKLHLTFFEMTIQHFKKQLKILTSLCFLFSL